VTLGEYTTQHQRRQFHAAIYRIVIFSALTTMDLYQTSRT